MIRSGSPFPLLMGLLALSVGGAKLAHTVEPHDLGDKAEGIERVGLAPQTSHQHKALRSAAEPQDLGEEDELQTGWGRRRRRRRRYGDNRRRYRDNRRRFVDNRRRMHCRIPTRRGTDFNSCRSTTSRRRTTCTARCKPGFSGSARTVTCEERHDAPGDLNSHHFPSCSPKACGARQTLDQATIAQCVLDHTGQKPYTGNCVMSGFDRSDCNGKVFEDTCRVTCKVGWSGSAATLSCPTNTVFSGKDPTCTPNTCAKRKLTAVQTAKFNMSNCDSIRPRTLEKCTATCNQGWHHPGGSVPTTLECPAEDKNGFPSGGAELKGDNPSCEPNTCHPPYVIDVSNLTDYSRIPEGVNFTDCMGKVTNETCRVDCKHGWWETNTWSVGKTTLRCSESGNFTGDLDTLLPICEPKPCRPPVPNEPTFHMLYDLFPNTSILNPKTYLDNSFLHLDPREYSTEHQLRLINYLDDKTSFKDDLRKFSTPLVHGVNFTACQASEVSTGQTCEATCWSGFTNGHSTPGYGVNKPMTLTCTPDGHLDVTNLTQCVGIQCKSLYRHKLETTYGPDNRARHTVNNTFRNATYNATDRFNGTTPSISWVGNVTGANFSSCMNLTTTEQCLPSCRAGFWMKPGEKPAALTCLETGDWKGAYPKCLPRDPLDTALICEVNMKLGGLTAEQVIEDRTFKNKTIDSIKAVLGVPISDVNRKLTIEVSFPGLITQRGKQTKGRPLDLKVKTNIFFMNKTEAVLDKIALTEAFSDKSTSNDTQQTSLYLGEGGNSHKKEKFAAVFASAANASVKVEKFGVAAVNVAKPDWRVNPFVKKVHMKSKMPLPHVQPNQTVRDPGVTEINIQGTYDRATGQWHKAPPPSDLMESDQELDDAETTHDLATLREIYRERIEEEDKTDDVELEEELVELALV